MVCVLHFRLGYFVSCISMVCFNQERTSPVHAYFRCSYIHAYNICPLINIKKLLITHNSQLEQHVLLCALFSWMFRILLRKSTCVDMSRRVSIYQYINISIYRCLDTSISRYIDILIYSYISANICIYICFLIYDMS